ncbi:MAG: DUF1122 family protein, partial [Sulfolobaceae archaeon]
YTFDLYIDDKYVGKSFYFSGRGEYKPWIEIIYDPWPRRERIEISLFSYIRRELGNGGKIFVTYHKDYETRELLYKGEAIVNTPLGLSLLYAGFVWFKDWYFTEGGNEGLPKIQANLPINSREELYYLYKLLDEVKNPEARVFIQNRIADLRK